MGNFQTGFFIGLGLVSAFLLWGIMQLLIGRALHGK